MRKFVVLLPAILLGCPSPAPQPNPPPQPDATDATPPSPTYDGATTSACFQACQALLAAGCKEGGGNCLVKLQVISDRGLEPNKANRNLPLKCDDLKGVKSPSDVTATGQACTLMTDGG